MLMMHEFFIVSCTAKSSSQHLQKGRRKKGIEEPAGVGPGGESPMPKLAKDFPY